MRPFYLYIDDELQGYYTNHDFEWYIKDGYRTLIVYEVTHDTEGNPEIIERFSFGQGQTVKIHYA